MSKAAAQSLKAREHPVLWCALAELRARGVQPWQIDVPAVGLPIIHVSPPAAEALGLVAETEGARRIEGAALHVSECLWRGCRLQWAAVHTVH